MKISPLAQGSSVPNQLNPTTQGTDPAKIERAKAIAAGQQPVEEPQQVLDAASNSMQPLNVKKIQMKTQMSTNRDDALAQNPVVNPTEVVQNEAKSNTIEEPAPVIEETKPLSPQFAALAKAKRALQVKERELAEREAKLASQNSGEYVPKESLKTNPLGVLLENGVTYDQLTEAIINNQQQPLDSKTIDALVEKKLNERLQKEFTTRDQQAESQVLADIKREIIQTVDENPNEYEAIRQAKAYDDVKELIHRTWKQTGEVLSTEEAIKLVEDQLIEEAIPFAKLNKVQKRLTPAEAAQVVAQTPTPKPNTKVMRTLTNRDTASPIMDRRSRAIAAMLGTLKR